MIRLKWLVQVELTGKSRVIGYTRYYLNVQIQMTFKFANYENIKDVALVLCRGADFLQ